MKRTLLVLVVVALGAGALWQYRRVHQARGAAAAVESTAPAPKAFATS